MEVREVTYTVDKIGRKWIQGTSKSGYKAQIEINDITKNWEVGEKHTFPAKVDFQRSRYGTKVYVYPISKDDLENAKKEKILKEIEKWKGYVSENAKSGRVYTNGIDKLRELSKGLSDKEKENINKFIEDAKKTAWARKAKSLLKKINPIDLDEEIDETNASQLSSRIKKIKNELYWIDRIKFEVDGLSEEEIPEDVKRELEREEKLVELKQRLSEAYSELKEQERAIEKFERQFDLAEKQLHRDKFLHENTLKSLLETYNYAVEKNSNLKDDLQEKMDNLKAEMERYDAEFKENYEEVEIPNAWMVKDLLKKIGGKLVVKVTDKKRMRKIDKFSLLFFALSAPSKEEIDKLYENVKEYHWYFPKDKLETAKRITETMKDWEKRVYTALQNKEGEYVGDVDEYEDFLPKGWNHIKREFVAILNEDLSLDFASHPENFTRSRANADLIIDLCIDKDNYKDNIGMLIVARGGSYRHLGFSIYRLDEDGWKHIDWVDDPEWKNVKMELFKRYVLPELEKIA